MQDVAQRIGSLEALEAIRNLRHEWYAKLDIALESTDPQESEAAIAWLTQHVTEDFVQTSNIHAPVTSRSNLTEFLKAVRADCTMSFHMLSNDQIEIPAEAEVEVRFASGSWYVLAMLTVQGRPLWVSCLTEERYAKQGGEWVVAELSLDYRFVTPYEAGWAERRFVEASLSRLAY